MKKTKLAVYTVAVLLVCLIVYESSAYYLMSQDTIVVGYLPSDHDSALFVADEKGMFENEGLNVVMVPFRSGTEMVQAADRGLIDIGYCGIAPALTGIDNGFNVKVLSPVNLEGSGIVVKNGSINSVAGLKGKKVATPPGISIQDILLMYLFYENNYSANSFCNTDVEVPLMDESLESDSVDAFIAWEPYVSQSYLEGSGSLLMHSSDIWPNHPCCVVIANHGFIDNNPQKVRKFLKVHTQATSYVQSNKNETAIVLSQKLGVNKSIESSSLTYVNFTSTPNAEFRTNVHKFSEFMYSLGYLKNNLTDDEIFDFSYL
nr:ABC transporter substrate-binding protein [uncultured Methanobacterium sp.]